MNINRNNYEEYFLLYVDNELSAAERNMVEAFVAAHTDLQEELVMLQQSIVKPEAVEFTGKENLLQPVAIDVAAQEQLLLLLDNELGAKEKEQVFISLQNNKVIKQEWELLQQAKLSPADAIIFEDKASLYKKEAGRVVPIKWWRVAAAAMLIGFGLWGAVSYLNKGVIKTGPAAETAATTVPPGNSKKNDPAATVAEEGTTYATKPADTENSTAKAIINHSPAVKVIPAKEKKETGISPKQGKKDDDIAVQQNDDAVPVPPSDNINNDGSNKKIWATVQPETQINKTSSTNEIPTELKNSIAIKTSLKSETGEKNFIAFDDEEKPKRTKLGGFFKKVKRVLERNTKIKTGSEDEVRIANMSFAMH